MERKEKMTHRVNLTSDGRSFLVLDSLPENLKVYGKDQFAILFDLRPQERGKVIMRFGETESARWHKSYLETPAHDPDLKYSYMFSGTDNANIRDPLPREFLPFFDYVNRNGDGYNQVVVNWYENGRDYIAQHSDCEVGMKKDANIVVISLGDERIFKLVPKKHIRIKESEQRNFEILCGHGSIITMGGDTQKNFRHGVPKSDSKAPRISITFRKFECCV